MAVNLHTTHYRFGVDELAESTHGWHAAEDANPAQGAIAPGVTFLLRFTVQETGGTAAGNVDNQFQCRRNAGAWQNITTTSTIVKAVAAAALTDAGNCTKRLSGTGTFESSGAGQTEDGLSGGNANDIAASGNSETECGLQIVDADTNPGDVIEFRLTSPDFTITNDIVPAITLAASQTFQQALAAAAVGVAALARKNTFKRTLAAAAVVVASLATKLVFRVSLAASAVGIAGLAIRLVMKIAMAAASVGAAALTLKASFKLALSATATGAASLATQFIAGVAGSAARAARWLKNKIGIGL